MKFRNFFGYKIYSDSLKNLNSIIEKKIELNKKIIINCINPHSFVVSLKDYIFFRSLRQTKYNIVDGFGVYVYFNFFKNQLVHRITGYDIYESLIKKNYKFFLLGSSKKNIFLIKKKLNKKKIFCYSPPFKKNFSSKTNEIIIKKINQYKPDVLFLGLGAPKQEKWVFKNENKIKVPCIISIGAVFDYITRNQVRAPKFIRFLGFEWLFRLIQKPSLWPRTLSALLFTYYLCINKKKINKSILNVLDRMSEINNIINTKKSFVFSAFNLAFASNLIQKKIKIIKNLYLWSDGIFIKFFDKNKKKIAGHDLINKINLNNSFKKINIIGEFNEKNKKFIKNKFPNLKIIHTIVPFASDKIIRKYVKDISSDVLVLITLPTPKQEILAAHILNKFKNVKIICIGGGLNIASGFEKKATHFFKKNNIEFIWRLRTDTKRRIVRIFFDIMNIARSIINLNIFKIIIKNDQ